jgi:amidohydrolase
VGVVDREDLDMTSVAKTPTAPALRDLVVQWRRHLHQRPELSFHEEQTAQFVHDTLADFGGLELSRPTPTSVLARLITGRRGPVLAIRADMDALAITEETGLPFASANKGVMHACGHDGHTAMLLGAVRQLLAQRDALAGEVRFIFQHAEEISPGGAEEMVQRGVMDGVQRVIGTHLWASLEVGKVGVVEGAAMAAPDTFWVTVRGKGGHAAIPQQTVDPIAVAAQVVTNLQQIVSRGVDPIDSAVVSVTQFHAGTAPNVIPEVAELNGTVRTFDAELRTRIPQVMERIIKGVTAAHGATYEFTYERGYRPVINDVEVTREMAAVVEAACGPGVLVTLRPTMGGEDFSAFLQKAPGSFFFIGAGNAAKGIVHPHHHPRFDIDEAALETGVKIFVEATRRYCGV